MIWFENPIEISTETTDSKTNRFFGTWGAGIILLSMLSLVLLGTAWMQGLPYLLAQSKNLPLLFLIFLWPIPIMFAFFHAEPRGTWLFYENRIEYTSIYGRQTVFKTDDIVRMNLVATKFVFRNSRLSIPRRDFLPIEDRAKVEALRRILIYHFDFGPKAALLVFIENKILWKILILISISIAIFFVLLPQQAFAFFWMPAVRKHSYFALSASLLLVLILLKALNSWGLRKVDANSYLSGPSPGKPLN